MGLSTMTDHEMARKIAVLDARDKVLRQRMTKQTQLSQASSYVGSCEDMCPERERYTRVGFQLSIFERDEQNQPDEYAMVKEYRRAGADQEEPLPHDLRTLGALETTVDYLVCNIMDDPRSKSPEIALDWYDFLWDRLRAIRKDITQQNICDQASAILVERCTRFHIHSCYAMNRVKDFDIDMNKRNLNDCLQMLRQIYNDLRDKGIICSGEFEFQKYDILLHLGEDALSTNIMMKTSEHRLNDEMKFIIQVFNAYTNNDYHNYFKLMERADYMTSCILSLYVNKVRLGAMRVIINAFGSRQAVLYPVDSLISSLGFDNIDDFKEFSASFEMEVQYKDGKYYLVLKKELINNIHQLAKSLPTIKSKRLVEYKMNGQNVGQLVYGRRELPSNPYRQRPLQTSENLYQKICEDNYNLPAEHLNSNGEEEGEEEDDYDEEYEEDRMEADDNDDEYNDEDDQELEVDEEEEEQNDENDIGGNFNEIKRPYIPETVEPKRFKFNLDTKNDKECSFQKETKTFPIKHDNIIPTEPILAKPLEEPMAARLSLEEPVTEISSFEQSMVVEEKTTTVEDSTVCNVDDKSDDNDDSFEIEYYYEVATPKIKKKTMEEVADLMPAGRLRKSARLPKLNSNHVNQAMKQTYQEPTKKTPYQNRKRTSQVSEDVELLKQSTTDEEKANIEFFKIVRMII